MDLIILFLAVVLILILANQKRPADRGWESRKTVRETIERPPFDASTARPPPRPRTLSGVAYVLDGDTIAVNGTQIRLFGIDAPELDHPYGKNAKWALVKLCKGHTIRAEIIETDDHGRVVAHCFRDDRRDLSAEMVSQGLALDWPKFSGGKYRNLEAADARKRLWLADVRQKGRMHVWEKFHNRQAGNGKES
ncbi:MAG: thermonuclease family protein [Rhizobiaceae bacterium]